MADMAASVLARLKDKASESGRSYQLCLRLLTPDGLRFICEANNYDAEKIGQYFLELLPTILSKD